MHKTSTYLHCLLHFLHCVELVKAELESWPQFSNGDGSVSTYPTSSHKPIFTWEVNVLSEQV